MPFLFHCYSFSSTSPSCSNTIHAEEALMACDSWFHLSTWLGYDAQLFKQTLVKIVLEGYLVDVITFHNQL